MTVNNKQRSKIVLGSSSSPSVRRNDVLTLQWTVVDVAAYSEGMNRFTSNVFGTNDALNAALINGRQSLPIGGVIIEHRRVADDVVLTFQIVYIERQ